VIARRPGTANIHYVQCFIITLPHSFLTGFLFKATPNPTNPPHKQAADRLPNNRNAAPSQKANSF
jgi:hypothetical protein